MYPRVDSVSGTSSNSGMAISRSGEIPLIASDVMWCTLCVPLGGGDARAVICHGLMECIQYYIEPASDPINRVLTGHGSGMCWDEVLGLVAFFTENWQLLPSELSVSRVKVIMDCFSLLLLDGLRRRDTSFYSMLQVTCSTKIAFINAIPNRLIHLP